jgi:hypothetical protein
MDFVRIDFEEEGGRQFFSTEKMTYKRSTNLWHVDVSFVAPHEQTTLIAKFVSGDKVITQSPVKGINIFHNSGNRVLVFRSADTFSD